MHIQVAEDILCLLEVEGVDFDVLDAVDEFIELVVDLLGLIIFLLGILGK